MPAIDYEAARASLEKHFSEVESDFLAGTDLSMEPALLSHFERIFQSRTQAYREVLLGCVLARLQNKAINIRKPYVNQGKDAYNGRTLDETVVNPFLQTQRIPCSQAPFLSAFRRSVTFDEETRQGLRDKDGYDALLGLIGYLVSEQDDRRLIEFLRYLLYRFLSLRQNANVPLVRLQRISLEQYGNLIESLLAMPSGGRFPVLLVVATFEAIKRCFKLDWTVEVQGINVADRSSGAGGDVTIKVNETILMAVEITERPVDQNRVLATFQTKIAPRGIEDYLFLTTGKVDEKSIQQARQYFSQGHEVNFLSIRQWILVTLATLGKHGRGEFNQLLVEQLGRADIPTSLKMAWNDQLNKLTTAGSW